MNNPSSYITMEYGIFNIPYRMTETIKPGYPRKKELML
jgi:hypothetical protein